MIQGINNHYVGLAAEYRVISELLIRGFNPARLMFDSGIDILLDDGRGIQVKTARISTRIGGKGAKYLTYNFNLTGGRRRNRKIINDKYDFLIFWLNGTDTFYIFPKSETPNQWHFQITPDSKSYRKTPYEKYKNNWELLNH